MDLGVPIAIGNTAQIYLYENKIVKVFNDFLPVGDETPQKVYHFDLVSSGLSVP